MAWTSQRHVEYEKSKYHSRLDKGLCPRCGKTPEAGRKFCKKCSDYQAKYQKKKNLGDGPFTDSQLANACRVASQLTTNEKLKDALLEAARRFRPEESTES